MPLAQRSGRNAAGTNRAASLPAGRRESSKLESLRSKKQKLSDIEDIPPSSLPDTVPMTRGRKRRSSLCGASPTDHIAPIVDGSEQRPTKRRRRSSSTPASPIPRQVPVQLQSRRHSRSRARSLTIDVEHALPSRASALLARKIHAFRNNPTSDIYTHLAGPDGAGTLLSKPFAGSAIPFAPHEAAGSQSARKPRERRRKVVDLTDKNAKQDLMEEWARMRQSQGTPPLSRTNEDFCFNLAPLCNAPVSSLQSDTPDFEPLESQDTMAGDHIKASFLTQVGIENTLPGVKKTDYISSVLPSDGRIDELVISSGDVEVLRMPSPGEPLHTDVGVDGTARNLDFLQLPVRALTLTPFREGSTMTNINQQAGAARSNGQTKDSHSVTFSQTNSFDDSSNRLDSDEEFYMLDIPEIFTLPWEPLESHLYVPPTLGKLISGMREQLTIEARARRRAEELYHAELRRRISAEKIIEHLQTELEEKQKDF